MTELDPPMTPPPTKPDSPTAKKDHAPILLMVLVGCFILGAAMSVLSVMTALYRAPLVIALIAGAVFGILLPLFFALRARSSLAKRGMRKSFRRVLLLMLILPFQLLVIMVVMFPLGRSVADHAKVLHHHTTSFAGDDIPVVSTILRKLETGSSIRFNDEATDIAATGDAGVAGDAGVVVVDGGQAPKSDSGTGALDAGAVDAGPVPPTGNIIHRSAFILEAEGGDKSHLVFHDLYDSGEQWSTTKDISELTKTGHVVQVRTAETSALVQVSTKSIVLVPRTGEPDVIVSAKQKVEKRSIQKILDAAPVGDAVVFVVELLSEDGKDISQALVMHNDGERTILRQKGDAIPDVESDDPVGAYRFRILDFKSDGTLLFEEEYTVGESRKVSLSSDTYTMNDRRMIRMDVTVPKVMTEMWRTGRKDPLNPTRSLQAVVAAALLPDGSVVFSANHIEKSKEGGIFHAVNADELRAFGPRRGDRPFGTSLATKIVANSKSRVLIYDPWQRIHYVNAEDDKTPVVWYPKTQVDGTTTPNSSPGSEGEDGGPASEKAAVIPSKTTLRALELSNSGGYGFALVNRRKIVDGKSKGTGEDLVVILSETEPTEVFVKADTRLPAFDTVVPPRDYPGVLQPLFEE